MPASQQEPLQQTVSCSSSQKKLSGFVVHANLFALEMHHSQVLAGLRSSGNQSTPSMAQVWQMSKSQT